MKQQFILLCLIFVPMSDYAQNSDFGIWTSLAAEKKINKKLTVDVEGEFRTRNDSKTADRWSLGLSADYKLVNGLKVGMGYDLLDDNHKEKITYHDNGDYNNWRPSYWGLSHRFHVDVTGDVDFGHLNLSLRERWQYTYRPEKTTDRYDFDNSWWENTTVNGKAKSVLRSRFRMEYNISHCKVSPYADVEFFNAWNVQKIRYTVGADWKIRKQHVVGLYYRYLDVHSDDDDTEPNGHVLGVCYKFKF